MPKIKTNRTAYKKYKVSSKGRVKRAQAFTSHNTAKKTAKRIRKLRKLVAVDVADKAAVKRMLPYSF